MSRRNPNESRIYVGNLPPDIREKDVEDLFYKFGKITFIDLKNRKGPPFAFVEFEDPRDAEDAVYARDGYDYDGYKLRVEFPRGNDGFSDRGDRGGFGFGVEEEVDFEIEEEVVVVEEEEVLLLRGLSTGSGLQVSTLASLFKTKFYLL